MRLTTGMLPGLALCVGLVGPVRGEDLEEIVVTSVQQVANTEPAGSTATLVSTLRYNPAVDLQSRGLPEAQSDLSILGGLFHATALKVGAVTILDPQTGHYTAELPIPRDMLSEARLLTGSDHALSGFNATTATLAYGLTELRSGGYASLGLGSNALWSRAVRIAGVTDNSRSGAALGGELVYTGSQGDGSVTNGDHDIDQVAIRAQRTDGQRQSDVVVGYQDKFYGWPGAYTGFASLAEIDHTKTKLLLVNHREMLSSNQWWEVGGFYRRLSDDYDFDRTTKESGGPGSFDHETESMGVGFDGQADVGNTVWSVSGQFSTDKLIRSTDLTAGSFNDRRIASVRLASEHRFALASGAEYRIRLGTVYDASNRERDAWMPLLRLQWQGNRGDSRSRWTLDYAGTSEVPGYTALKSPPNGLFGGNANLDRSRADSLALIYEQSRARHLVSFKLFSRHSDDLVDWTYLRDAPFVRQANAVDVDVRGIQGLWQQGWSRGTVTVGYTYLEKDANYGDAAVDASYYVLNYEHHRLTLALTCAIGAGFEFRADNEYRRQAGNPLRGGTEAAFQMALGLHWQSAARGALTADLILDNVTGEDFEEFPGTPALGRQMRLQAQYRW